MQIDGFIYPANFFILYTHQKEGGKLSMPIILGKPFLATIDSRIHVRSGLINLTFKNNHVEVNIYDLMAQPNLDEDDIMNAYLLGALLQELVHSANLEDPLEPSPLVDVRNYTLTSSDGEELVEEAI